MAAKNIAGRFFIVSNKYEYAQLDKYMQELGCEIKEIKTYTDNSIKLYATGDINKLEFARHLMQRYYKRIAALENVSRQDIEVNNDLL